MGVKGIELSEAGVVVRDVGGERMYEGAFLDNPYNRQKG